MGVEWLLIGGWMLAAGLFLAMWSRMLAADRACRGIPEEVHAQALDEPDPRTTRL